MNLKLNNSEIMAILTSIDDSLGYDLEPLERETWLSIVKKIKKNTHYKHHNIIDDFAGDILDYANKDQKVCNHKFIPVLDDRKSICSYCGMLEKEYREEE